MTKLNIKKGDNVLIIAGKEKGKTGKVLLANSEKVVVDGVNIVTKHQKAKSQKDKGGIVKKPAPIQISNVMIICSKCGKATRVARKQVEGKNVRVCKKCGASLDKAFVKALKKEAKQKDKETKEVEEVAKTPKKVTTKKPETKITKTVVKESTPKKSSAKVSTPTVRRSTNRGK